MTEGKILNVVEPGTESNCYLIESRGHVVVIDPNVFEEIDGILQSRGWKLDHIFLTHEHFDHILGLEQLRSAYQVPVWASEAASRGIESSRANMSAIYDMFVYYRQGTAPKERHRKFACRAAEQTFSQELELFWQGHRFYFRILPGHSAGSTLIFLDDDTLFCGDYLLEEKTKAAVFSGGSEETIEQMAKPYLDALPAGIHIYRGHGTDFILKG